MSTYDWMYREPPPDFLSTINKYAADGVTWSGMEKLLEFDAYDEQTGCPNVVAVDRTIKANFGLTKMASSFPAEMLEKIAEIEDKPDRIHVVGNALGATETFGSNRNQDSFPRLGLMNSDPKTYGHKTFEDAHVFKHHVNKDPNKSIGKVTYAFYDSLLDKVLLLYYILKDKAPHIVDRLEKGESLETSMGCFLAGAMVQLFDGSTKTIETVAVGDRVLNCEGKASVVSELHVRQYRGKIFRITPLTEDVIEATHEHPFLTLRREEVMEGSRWKSPDQIDLTKKDWVEAKDLREGDYLLRPVDREVWTPDYATRAAARLLGYYAAEGHIVRGKDKQPAGVEFSTHVDDPIHQEIEALCAEFGTINKPVTYPRSNTEYGASIQVRDPRLAQMCQEHVGYGAKTKRLSPGLMQWDPEVQLEFLGAYINGDGWQNDGKWQPGSVGISTANSTLAGQLSNLLLRCDIIGTLQYIHHRAGVGFTPEGGSFEWILWISKAYSRVLANVAQKVKAVEGGQTNARRRLVGGYLLVPIEEIEESPIEYVGTVYNFEVEDADEAHSYVVNGVAVHNCRCPYDVCSICGKKAKDRTEYCAHLRDHPNMVYPDGRKVMAHTPHPRFFDQSHVAKGADPIAKTLKVVDTKAKEAWDRRPKIHPMYARTPELAKAASFVEEMGRNTKTAFEIRQSLEKTAAPYRDARGIPMGDPDAPRRSDTEINAMLDDPLLKINSEDLKRWRSRFHKTAECPAVQGTGNCSCHEKLAEAQTLEAFLKAGRQVQASIDKRIPGMAQAVPAEAVGAETVAEQPIHRDAATNEIKIAGYAQEFLDTLEFLEPDLETDFLAKLAEGRSLEEVLSSLTASGIVLKNYEFDFLTKVADRGSRSNILVSPKLVRHGILGKIAESVRDARSYLPRHMFKRASFLAGALRKYANQQFTPQQVAQLAQLMQMMQAGPGLSPRGQGTYIPDSLRRSMADEALLHLYRTNMGQMRPSAFDEVPDMSLMPGRKTGSVASFVDACRGVPVNACLKYAYRDRSHIDVDAEWLWRDIPESDVWFQTFVANTRGDSEKTASLLAAGPGDLLDAAATVHLRFVRGVLVPGSTKE